MSRVKVRLRDTQTAENGRETTMSRKYVDSTKPPLEADAVGAYLPETYSPAFRFLFGN